MRVLIVEDSELERVLLRSILQRAGFEVVGEADSGVRAVEQFRLHQPDVAILDLMLPRMSGIEVARAILTLHPAARLVALSGLVQPSVKAEALQVGMREFIHKPIEQDALLQALRRAVET